LTDRCVGFFPLSVDIFVCNFLCPPFIGANLFSAVDLILGIVQLLLSDSFSVPQRVALPPLLPPTVGRRLVSI